MKKKQIIIVFIIAVILVIGLFAVIEFNKVYNKSIIHIKDKESTFFYIAKGFDYQDVRNSLLKQYYFSNIKLFDLMAEVKSYKTKVKAGKYKLTNGMSANALISLLRSGNQTPINITFNNIRFLPKLAAKISPKFSFDSTALMQAINNEELVSELGYNKNTLIAMFLPNTYQMWWTYSPEEFLKRIKKEHQKFWNADRIAKAKKMRLSPLEVTILASIVQEETNKISEMSRIAGVYMNRLDIGMLLQADPTARFAHGDFSVKRVNYDYLKTDSPYNTYLYKGLPPGPICMVNPTTIDKVLNYEKHKYYYFCAKPDNSGTHVFAKNNRQHNNNANAYHRWLDQQKIYR